MLRYTIETVEKHYMPFVRELRDRVRRIRNRYRPGRTCCGIPNPSGRFRETEL